jgi:hypothetical protein
LARWTNCLAVLVLLSALWGPAKPVQAIDRPEVYCHASWTLAPQPRVSCIALAHHSNDVCAALHLFASAWALPEGFFARLIWQESRFSPSAVSPAGALGIAQFMPSTGRLRGLRNPYNPVEALARSAEYLRFLADKYGNLGLAAAAYNSGEGRTSRFLSLGGNMPIETENYVRIITGHPLASWIGGAPDKAEFNLDPKLPFKEACIKLAETRTINKFEFEPGPYQPWGVQIGANFRSAVAERIFERVRKLHSNLLGDERPMIVARRNANFGKALRYHAMIGRPTQAEAQALCTRLRRAGGSCIVARN